MEFMDFLKVYQAYQEYQKTLAPKEAPPAHKQEQAPAAVPGGAPAPVAPPAATPPDVEASLNNAMLRIAQLEQRILNPTMENPDAKGIEDVVNRMLGE